MKLDLRPATEADTAFLLAVFTSTRMDELVITGWTDEQKAAFCQQQFTAQTSHYREHYPAAEYSIISANERPAGRLSIERWPQEIRIMEIALLPEFRAQGIGTYLLNYLMQEAVRTNRKLSIHVEKMNPALRLYTRLGFKLIKEVGIYLLMAIEPKQAAPAP
jgi:ribosomal protein S18 acetylase RimI-like enzyme